MNYRHAYHAGNFADVLKHGVLTQLIVGYLRKDKPFAYLDTEVDPKNWTVGFVKTEGA